MGSPSTGPSGRHRLTEEIPKNVSTMFTKMRQLLGQVLGDTVQAGSLGNLSQDQKDSDSSIINIKRKCPRTHR